MQPDASSPICKEISGRRHKFHRPKWPESLPVYGIRRANLLIFMNNPVILESTDVKAFARTIMKGLQNVRVPGHVPQKMRKQRVIINGQQAMKPF
jgi:hypothetical protein